MLTIAYKCASLGPKEPPPSVIPFARPVSTNQIEGLDVFTTAQPDAPVMGLTVKTAKTDAI